MEISTIDNSQRTAAKVAGWSYLLTMAIVVFANYVLLNPLLVRGNAAWLWLKSHYIPKWLALFGVISSAFCVICAFVYLIFPGFAKPVNPYWFDSPMAFFEIVLAFWLLFKGLASGIAEPAPARS
jgi:hypothetical protein